MLIALCLINGPNQRQRGRESKIEGQRKKRRGKIYKKYLVVTNEKNTEISPF